MAVRSINPYSGQVLKEFEELSDEALSKAIERSQQVFQSWRSMPLGGRSALMRNAARVMRKNQRHYAETITLEMGKVIGQSMAEIEKCASVCEYYADHAEAFLQNEPLPVDEGEAYISYDPLGPVLAIMPWNFPFWQVFRFAAPNLTAGNTGLLKHASNVPQCAKAIEDIFLQAGFPEGVFQALLIPGSRVGAVIDHKHVQAVTLTGSDGAGQKVAEQSGRNLKKTVLELGGSDAFIVLEDADLQTAASTAVKARMINTGQSCIAAKRFIVQKSVADQFLELFEEGFARLKFGDPMSGDSDYGPLARKDLAKTLEDQVQRSVEMGAKIIYGTGKAENGIFFHPVIIAKVKPGMPAYEEELFGPVAVFFTAENEEEALAIANDSQFGLGASLWTRDQQKAKALAGRIESGSVFINDLVASHPKAPFGGIKNSGYGRELSYVGLREFMNIKTVWLK